MDLTQKLMLSVAEAAALTGFGLNTITDACNCGALPSKRPGRREIRILRADLDVWLRELPALPLERPSKIVPIRRVNH